MGYEQDQRGGPLRAFRGLALTSLMIVLSVSPALGEFVRGGATLGKMSPFVRISREGNGLESLIEGEVLYIFTETGEPVAQIVVRDVFSDEIHSEPLPSAVAREIRETGAAGMFAANPQTFKRMHSTCFMPDLADRKLREQWAQEGASTIHQRAMGKALGILANPNAAALDAEADERIHAAFDGLVKGDSVLPEGWVRAVASTAPTRERRVNRRRTG